MASQRNSCFPGPIPLSSIEIVNTEQMRRNQFQTVLDLRDSRDDFENTLKKKEKKEKKTRVSGAPMCQASLGLGSLLEVPSEPGSGPSVEGQRGGEGPG